MNKLKEVQKILHNPIVFNVYKKVEELKKKYNSELEDFKYLDNINEIEILKNKYIKYVGINDLLYYGGIYYKSENITALLGELGLPREFTPAFTKEFSDEQFKNAYDSAKILSDAEVNAAAQLNLEFAKLGNSFDVLQGKLLNEFAPAIDGIIKYIEGKLNFESAEKATKYIGAGLGGLALIKGGQFALTQDENPSYDFETLDGLTLCDLKLGDSISFNGSETYHGVLPVTKGIRYALNVWMTETDFDYPRVKSNKTLL
jgi:hypothetical protein